jgi:hypothetical protein
MSFGLLAPLLNQIAAEGQPGSLAPAARNGSGEAGQAPYSSISAGVAGPASGFSSISTMQSDPKAISAAAAANT